VGSDLQYLLKPYTPACFFAPSSLLPLANYITDIALMGTLSTGPIFYRLDDSGHYDIDIFGYDTSANWSE
jgi:hypothetical protein